MTLNLADAESSFSKGKVDFEMWLMEAQRNFKAPLAETQMGMLFGSLTDQDRMNVPEIADFEMAFEKLIGRTGQARSSLKSVGGMPKPPYGGQYGP